MQRERILIVRIAGLGDIATASTILSRLRIERPRAHVTWMCSAAGATLVRLFDGVDEIIEVDEQALYRGSTPGRISVVLGVWRQLASRQFDLVLVAHPDRRYRWLVRPIRARRLRMLDRAGRDRLKPVPDRFFGDDFACLVDRGEAAFQPGRFELADVRARVSGIDLPARARPVGGVNVVLIPGGARNALRDDPLRRWPLDRYAEVARAFLAQGLRVAVLGDAGDQWVRAAFDGVAVVDLVGQLTIPQTLRVMAECGLVIAHDTGPLHFARLVRANTIALFGPTTPRRVIGEPGEVTVLWGGSALACRPCYDGHSFAPCTRNRCLENVSVSDVLSAAQARLRPLEGSSRQSRITV